jgi:endonuclease YncB( thermonuclease family)
MFGERPDPWGRSRRQSLFDIGQPKGRNSRDKRLLWASISVAALVGIGVGLVLPGDMLPAFDARQPESAPELIYNPDPPHQRRQDTPTLPPAGVSENLGAAPAAAADSVSFGFCAGRTGDNCVIDGDSFILNGETIRLAGIDTAEIGGARCDGELALAKAAEARLHALLNSGPVSLKSVGSRDRDRYGRLLRDAVINGQSVSDQLLAEGLAHEWRGGKESWCNG